MRRFLHALAALLVLSVLVSCSSSDDDGDTTTTEADGSSSSTTASEDGSTTSTPDDLATTDVLVYFVRGETVAVGGATAEGVTVGAQAMEVLLAGPAGDNAAAGMGTQIPPGTELLGLDVADGVATVDLSEEFTSGGGSLAMQLRVAQVVYTLMQFPTVDQVDFLIDGAEVEGIGGEGLPTSYDSTDGFADVTPQIMITTPVPGEVLSTPINVEGIANTFEGTVRWSLGTTVGKIIDEGFTTASAGNGTYGDFSIEIAGDGSTGTSVVTVWEDSAETGDRINVYEVPITIE